MRHLLIADDDHFITKIFKEKFEAAGYRVSSADNGESVIEALKENKPDAILLDLILPDMNGVGVLQFIRSNKDLADLPVIVVSNSSYFSGMVQAAWHAGATHFINKEDCNLNELVSQVDGVLNSSGPAQKVKAPVKKDGSTVLLVDDDTVIHGVLEFFLNQAGFSVTSAFDGVEAFEMASENPPDIMILDGLMPTMDGFEVMEKWSKDETLSKIPVLMMTSVEDQKKKDEMTEKGVAEYLIKPFNLNELVKLVSKHVEAKSKP
jgi:DNA-binding response OmpR family regulator